MSMFPSITIAGTGLDVDQTWIDTISGNVANAEDAVTPGQPVYRDQEVLVSEAPGPTSPVSSHAGSRRPGRRRYSSGACAGHPHLRPEQTRSPTPEETSPTPTSTSGMPDDLARRGPGQLRSELGRAAEQRHGLQVDPRDQALTIDDPRQSSPVTAIVRRLSRLRRCAPAGTAAGSELSTTSSAAPIDAAATRTTSGADNLALEGATGQANVADVTVAATEAQLAVQLASTVRDEGVSALNSIMSMQAG